MDESKGKEFKGVAVDSVVTKIVGTGNEVEERQEHVVFSERVTVEEEDDGRGEVGDVMVEVLGSEVVFDGVKRFSGEMGGDDLSCQRSEFRVVNDVEGDHSRVDESGDCNDVLAVAFSGSQDVEGCGISKEKTIDVVAERDIERPSGDAGGLHDVELVDYKTESSVNDNGNNVSIIKSTTNGKMVCSEEENLEAMKGDDKVVNSTFVDLDTRPREHDVDYDARVVSYVAGLGCDNVPDNVTVNGGRNSGEGSITGGQEKPVILDSVSVDAENANSKQLDLHTQSSVIGSMDGANEGIPVAELDKLVNVNIIKEGLQSVGDEKFDDAALTASVSLQNGVLDKTDMEIDVPGGNLINSENQPAERGKDIKTSVIPASLSRVSGEETSAGGMDVDAADANMGNNGRVCETPYDDLKTDHKTQVSEAVILAKCNSGNALANNSHNSKQDGKSSAAPVTDESGVAEGAIEESERVSDASNIECLDNHTVDGVGKIGLNRHDLKEAQESIQSEQVSMDYDLPNEGEETMHSEQISVDYDLPNEEEELMRSDHVSADCDLPNVSAGPFIVETEDPDEYVGASGYEDADYGSPHGEDGRLDTHVVHPFVEGLEQEADDDANSDSYMEDDQDEQAESANAEQVEEQEVGEEHVSSSKKPRTKEGKNSTTCPTAESLLQDHRVIYDLPPEYEGEFSVSDLVWGKVKTHPWWPGQIFHPSDSSEKAMKYLRKDCYLVAYFGDKTFAWNEHSVLKPFRNHFSEAERQTETESFQNAVECALTEVSRRTELGLACCCVSHEAFNKIRYQMVENAGIKKESIKRDGVDTFTELDNFQPDKLLGYVRSLAVFPTSSVDRLDLVIAKAQLTAFVRQQGIDALANYHYYEGIPSQGEHENSAIGLDSKITVKGPKRKHDLKDIVYQRRREKSMTQLMGETMYYLDGEFDSPEEDDSLFNSGVKRKTASFKVGDCIRRVANQLTGSSSILKGGDDGDSFEYVGDGANEVLEASNDSPAEMPSSSPQQFSLEDMLSQLYLCAQDPMKGYSFLDDLVSFFSGVRNMAVSNQRQRLRKKPGRKQKASTPASGIPESFEFDDRNDSYWKDMVVQDDPEGKPARRARKRKGQQVISVDSEKPSQSKPRKSSRKQYFHGPLSTEVETSLDDAGKQSQLPTELLMNFTGMGSIPSEMKLNKTFKTFGPLKESETEIDAESNRARVVFKKRSDAEVAYSSAAMFNIFGSLVVNYQLNYTPSAPFKTPPLLLTDNQEKTS